MGESQLNKSLFKTWPILSKHDQYSTTQQLYLQIFITIPTKYPNEPQEIPALFFPTTF